MGISGITLHGLGNKYARIWIKNINTLTAYFYFLFVQLLGQYNLDIRKILEQYHTLCYRLAIAQLVVTLPSVVVGSILTQNKHLCDEHICSVLSVIIYLLLVCICKKK